MAPVDLVEEAGMTKNEQHDILSYVIDVGKKVVHPVPKGSGHEKVTENVLRSEGTTIEKTPEERVSQFVSAVLQIERGAITKILIGSSSLEIRDQVYFHHNIHHDTQEADALGILIAYLDKNRTPHGGCEVKIFPS